MIYISLILVQKPTVDRDEFYCWESTKSGDYTVKSGYDLACKVKNSEFLQHARMLPSHNKLKENICSL